MRDKVGNVFGTDVIIASLMAANRSVYSWDVVVERVKDVLIFDKRSIDVASVPTNPIGRAAHRHHLIFASTISPCSPRVQME